MKSSCPLLLGLVFASLSALGLASPGTFLPVSTASPAYGPSNQPNLARISANGRFVVFESAASDLAPHDSNGQQDVFLLDRATWSIEVISVNASGGTANGFSQDPSISDDGRYVCFSSTALDLVPVANFFRSRVYVRDRLLGTTRLVSESAEGAEADDGSELARISASGGHVVFLSWATNLVPNDQNGRSDIFVKDLQTGSVNLVSTHFAGSHLGCRQPVISADGRFVGYEAYTTRGVVEMNRTRLEVYYVDRQAGTPQLVDVPTNGQDANGQTEGLSLSDSGRWIGFNSLATNLVPGDTNQGWDLFVRDMQSGMLSRPVVTSSGSQANKGSFGKISRDGTQLIFSSSSTNILASDTNGVGDVFVVTIGGQNPTLVSSQGGVPGNGESYSGELSGDGQSAIFLTTATNFDPTDLNGRADLFVRALSGSSLTRLSKPGVRAMGRGSSSAPAISEDGVWVAFESSSRDIGPTPAPSGYTVYLVNLETDERVTVSRGFAGDPANETSGMSDLSADGRYVVFSSFASNLTPGDTNGREDVFYFDRVAGTLKNLTKAAAGGPSVGSNGPKVSRDGSVVAFSSTAANLVPNDANGASDCFVWNRSSNTISLVSASEAGVQGNAESMEVDIAAEGRYVAFVSSATNLLAGSTSQGRNVYRKDLQTGEVVAVSAATGSSSPSFFTTAQPSISADGRFVAFLGTGPGGGSSGIYVRDVQNRVTTFASQSSTGAASNGHSSDPSISDDGRLIAFSSSASDIVVGDINGKSDVFIRDLSSGAVRWVRNESVPETSVSGPSKLPALTGPGAYLALVSERNLAPSVNAGGSFATQIYRYEVPSFPAAITGQITLQDYVGPRPRPTVTLRLVPVGGGMPVTFSEVPLMADGSYRIGPNRTGQFWLYCRASTFLWSRLPGVLTLGNVTVSGASFSLVNGDCDGDNAITVFDYIVLSEAFGAEEGQAGWDPSADLDGDGLVTVFDYIVLSTNFDREGDSL